MEEFIMEIRNNIGMQYINADKKSEIQNNISTPYIETEKRTGKYRDLFSIFLSGNPEVKIIEKCSMDGDVTFEVSMGSLGVCHDTLIKYKMEITSDFTANFLGEFLIRENIDKFAKILIELKENYASRVTLFEHRKFGMKIFKDKFVMIFHISLLQSILTEDFKKKCIYE